MGIVAWVVMGFLAGGLGGWVTGRRAGGCLPRIVVGVLGALIGGAIARAAGMRGVTELSIRSVAVATVGASLLLLVLQAVEGRRRG
jgi:uncharacterized membrane protein YeaQ/YmgE (transglycosylase-associated protein family)